MTLFISTFNLIAFVLAVSSRKRGLPKHNIVANDTLLETRILPQYLDVQPESTALGVVCTHYHCFSQSYLYKMTTAREDFDEAVIALGVTLERFMVEFPLYDADGPSQDMFRTTYGEPGEDTVQMHLVTIKLASLMWNTFRLQLVLVDGKISSCFIEESDNPRIYRAAVKGYKDKDIFTAVYQGQTLTIEGTSHNLVRKGVFNEEYLLYLTPKI